MVDFRSLRRTAEGTGSTDPIEIFRTLPKAVNVNDLWDTQAAALRAWHARRSEADLLLKLNTGSGKTLVGLLIAEAMRRELRRPILYLAPTRQLVDQVAAEASGFGIPVETYDRDQGLSTPFRNGERTLIATYQVLFNGKSRFGLLHSATALTLGSVILDDAHTGAASVRDAFSLTITRHSHPELFQELGQQFRYSFSRIGASGRFEEMLSGRDEGILEVPYWAWIDAAEGVRQRLQALPEDTFAFPLPFLRDHFQLCHALFSSTAFTITSLLPLVHLLPSFSDCRRRVFLTATLADDGALVRTFGANPASVSKPITSRSVAGLGERMVLAPTLRGLTRDESVGIAVQLCREAADRGHGAAILVPSEQIATGWSSLGQVVMKDDVADAVSRLREPSTRTSAVPIFVNRYDGMDLPQDSCRVLILDGKPRGASAYEIYRATVLQGAHALNVTLAQRVEQGMGRGTRGAADHCVVILLGRDLVEWIGLRDSLESLTPGTRAQVELGLELTREVSTSSAILEVARQCLDRNDEWKQLHAERISEAGGTGLDSGALVEAAKIERRAFEKLLHQDPHGARELLVDAASDVELEKPFRGWILQLAARAAFLAGDPTLAESLQKRAYSESRALMKPQAGMRYEARLVHTGQATNVAAILSRYQVRGAVMEAIEQLESDLHPSASVSKYEEAVRRLGEFLGFASERPDSSTGEGPDNLWMSPEGPSLVIECKHRKTSPLAKDDHGQLRTSLAWYAREHGAGTPLAVFVHRDGEATGSSGLLGSEVLVLTFTNVNRLVDALRAAYRTLASPSIPGEDLQVRAAAALREHQLEARSLADGFLRPCSPSSPR